MNKQGLLKRPVYVTLMWLIVTAFLAVTLPLTGWLRYCNIGFNETQADALPVYSA